MTIAAGGAVAEPPSFNQFVEDQYPVLVASLAFRCGDAEVASELAQDALARAYQSWARVSRLDRPGAWVQTVAFNLARSRFRRLLAERRALARHGAGDGVATGLSPGQIPDQVDVRRAVAQLPARQREVVIDHYLLDRPVAEIAERLGISSGAVRTALFKARASLGDTLGPAAMTTGSQEVQHG